ncbi:hypothetical protein K438DRAFT_1769025 [Mycena galopus ATCC 62051]|nr:hypothetical protein K438DRAFT_1769025 [Mycena galopus ATCC 62051]
MLLVWMSKGDVAERSVIYNELAKVREECWILLLLDYIMVIATPTFTRTKTGITIAHLDIDSSGYWAKPLRTVMHKRWRPSPMSMAITGLRSLWTSRPGRSIVLTQQKRPINADLRAAYDWWIDQHLGVEFDWIPLPCLQLEQRHGFNCGLFAANRVAHYIKPKTRLASQSTYTQLQDSRSDK